MNHSLPGIYGSGIFPGHKTRTITRLRNFITFSEVCHPANDVRPPMANALDGRMPVSLLHPARNFDRRAIQPSRDQSGPKYRRGDSSATWAGSEMDLSRGGPDWLDMDRFDIGRRIYRWFRHSREAPAAWAGGQLRIGLD
jgi:hypothetical protein